MFARQTLELFSTDASVVHELDRWISAQQDTWHDEECQTLGAASVGHATDASVATDQGITVSSC
jgi:hypothetical protein